MDKVIDQPSSIQQIHKNETGYPDEDLQWALSEIRKQLSEQEIEQQEEFSEYILGLAIELLDERNKQ
ncbi:MAG: hypothetical protein EZS28_001128 [Streblomastix strix]|nr:MAG: hypothetical protein EZS28_001128 [Streblomastix strix]